MNNRNELLTTNSDWWLAAFRLTPVTIGVGYDDDLKVAADVLQKVCSEHPKVLDEPAEIDLRIFDVSVIDGWVCI